MHTILYKRQTVKEILNAHSLALKKRWGQNFLTNHFFAEKITSLVLSLANTHAIQEPLHIWEIGAGLGSLSALFLANNVRLTVFEIDYGLINFLEKEFAKECAEGKLSIITGDAEKTVAQHVTDASTMPHMICGNLPYSCAVRILVKINSLAQLHVPAVYMIQKEAVERLVSKVGEKQYGISSILMQSIFSLKQQFSISADSFFPMPNVESAVFSCSPRATYIDSNAYALLCSIVRAAFSQRRKKLQNTLVPMLLSMKNFLRNMRYRKQKK